MIKKLKWLEKSKCLSTLNHMYRPANLRYFISFQVEPGGLFSLDSHVNIVKIFG